MNSLCIEFWQQLQIKSEIERVAAEQKFSAPKELAMIWNSGRGYLFLLQPGDRCLSDELRAVLRRKDVQKLYDQCRERKFEEILHSVQVPKSYENYVNALRKFIDGQIDAKKLRGFEDDMVQNMKNSEYPPALRLGFELAAIVYRYLLDRSQFAVLWQIKQDYVH